MMNELWVKVTIALKGSKHVDAITVLLTLAARILAMTSTISREETAIRFGETARDIMLMDQPATPEPEPTPTPDRKLN